MAAISIGSAAPAAASAAKSSATKGFDSVMAGVGHAAHEADASAHDAAEARAAEQDDRDDADRRNAKRDHARDDREDPAALLALANSVAAITRGDSAAGGAKGAGTASGATGEATPAGAAAQAAQPTAAETPPGANALAALPTIAQQAPASAVKPTPKATIDAATASTADILAARAAKVAPIAASDGDGKDAADGGDGEPAPAPMFGAAAAAAAPPLTVAPVSPAGGDVLAAGGADRQLDLAKGEAWLDGLARDIASTADSGGRLHFQLSPPALGDLHVELARGDAGTAVKMTAATVDAQAILADARPRLIESARAHGVHISEATVGLGGAGTSTSGQNRDPSGDNSSNQSRAAVTSDAGGNANGQTQSRPQSEPDLYHGVRRQGMIASTPTGGARQDLDAGYA